MGDHVEGSTKEKAAAEAQAERERVIVITGVRGYWGSRVAETLCTNDHNIVIGIDDEPPDTQIKGLDFIQADIRNPLLVDLFRSEQVDTVCHLAFLESVRPNETAYDFNVRGTTHIFESCVEAGVRKIIFKSSTSVYGAQPGFSAFLTEEQPLLGSLSNGTIRDLIEIETYCNSFRDQQQEPELTVLRFANIIGPKSTTSLTQFLEEPLAPKLLGFDPLWQIIHENDVIAALVFAIEQDIHGCFNLAADGPLPLSKLIALAGKTGIPVIHWFVYWGNRVAGNRVSTNRYLPFEPDYLRYNLVADLQKMHEVMGFTPQYTAEESLREFAGIHRTGRFLPESKSLALDEERLRDTIDRRRRIRKQQSSDPSEQVEE